jgi:protein involved in ribonucleotide reduction
MDVVFFSNVTNNTTRFADKLSISGTKTRIPLKEDFEGIIERPYILIVPTYGASDGTGMVPHQVKKFLKDNSDFMVGVIAMGNRNFGNEFAKAGKIISERFNVPYLYSVELAGMAEDVEKVNTIIKELEYNNE